MYAATAVLVHVDSVVLPGVDVGVPAPVVRALPGLAATPAPDSPAMGRITILILGIDRRPHHDPAVDGPPNSDSIHLLNIDPVTRSATVLALPRDLYVEMPSPEKKGDFWEARINQAYHFGEQYKYPGGGPGFAKRVIEYTFHGPVDYYMVIDWVAVADVVDALGGVDVTVPAELSGIEGFNPRDGNAFPITIPAGQVHMDAVTALAYARFRDDDQGDFGRIERQQQVMRAAGERALQLGWLTQAPQLYGRFRGAIDTDLSLIKLPGMLNLFRIVGPERVTMSSAAGEHTEAVKRVLTPWGEDVLVPNWDVMAPIIRAGFTDPAVAAEGASVGVINATGVRGQDQRAAAFLRRFSLPSERVTVVDTAAPLAAAQTTSITYSGEAAETARRVASWLGLTPNHVSRVELDAAAPPSVTVTLGNDVRLPDDERFQHYHPR
jgi:LCP family protein required for cell wall assembly